MSSVPRLWKPGKCISVDNQERTHLNNPRAATLRHRDTIITQEHNHVREGGNLLHVTQSAVFVRGGLRASEINGPHTWGCGVGTGEGDIRAREGGDV